MEEITLEKESRKMIIISRNRIGRGIFAATSRRLSQIAIEVNCKKNEKLMCTIDFIQNHLPSSLIQFDVFEKIEKDTNVQWWQSFGIRQDHHSFTFSFSDTAKNQEFSSILPLPSTFQTNHIRNHFVSLRLAKGQSSKSEIREIVLPYDMRISGQEFTSVSEFSRIYYEKKKGHSTIYSISHITDPDTSISLRVFPTKLPTVILYCDNFEDILNRLTDKIHQSKHIPSEIISGTHFFHSRSLPLNTFDSRKEEKERQIQFLSLYEVGLDFRLSNCPDTPFSFLEGSNVLLQQTVPELQSTRLLGGDASVRETKFGYSGDCWSETRTMTKYKLTSYLPQFLQSLLSFPVQLHSLTSLQSEKSAIEDVKQLWRKGGPSMRE